MGRGVDGVSESFRKGWDWVEGSRFEAGSDWVGEGFFIGIARWYRRPFQRERFAMTLNM